MNLKQMVGIEASKYVKDGMIVGLGTGSTAYYMIEELGRRVKEENLQIVGVPTSIASKKQAEGLGIPVKTIDEVPYVDLTIDGADEIDPDFGGIKGGGAALLFEKIVATYSKKVIWIVDQSKMVPTLGKFPLPIEVIPYGHQQVLKQFSDLGWQPSLRKNAAGEIVVTDCGHYIIDLHLEKIDDTHKLAKQLDTIVGVVEHGLFLDMVHTVIIGTPEGVKTIHAN
ncbi:ribose-5-phosphate isomerase RpiA [Enterococcus columbae]|uniref:Ribose-5-phosphate isomerase A n=1 Tax=Enterococcus columbae DSM 7374 = ATCC 51263 TaxID=1121865 RepID=S0KE86_9ENTE|nr:ribose-5-phosphate isomerase RpiA [Enterococcus columbae]EOT38478.1 ribose-5-phosphate isomerase A [Enterococcus columbae DSM 7374 = ATCC 51263]EOW87871.1 ribose-5-phosphate isomerase A [Enterococcus columbae DSM 7374 = ATCC 51263]OJG22020.1 ribose-5-phosphate isomerase A [Enterococcus columbae DSM 7374 = ATCC 51263]